MRNSRLFFFCLCMVLAGAVVQPVRAQLGFDLDIKKPPPYEDRLLKAEKTGDKKLKGPKKFFQNLTTHYNYYFNANNKLNEIIERAKQSHTDDYSQLLPFYNYTLETTSRDEEQLDSVIYKSQTAIVMHDLRNDWIDNMYMLWGAAFYFQQKFDSASLMFQFINYAFAEKEKDGYYRYIGSRLDGNNALSVSTKEDNSFLKKTFSTTPSRNDAFIWQIRSLIEAGNLTYAGSLIATLKQDPVFPERLRDDLEEVQAYWFYKQQIWDSSATHLLNALSQAGSKQEKARWEYLAAQMFEKTGQPARALELYSRARSHATDPVMDVYARLNMVRLNQLAEDRNEDVISKNVAELVKMARRPKYEDYRDVIYFMAAQMEMERKNWPAAQELLLKSAKYNLGNLASRGNVFMQIADIAYDQKKYLQAASYYDSVDVSGLKEEDIKRLEDRKKGLAKVVREIAIIDRQDSLQAIARMPEEERNALVKKIVKQLRKQQGLADENATVTSGKAPVNTSTTAPPSLFDTKDKGEWYFYNGSLKTQGLNQFKQNWGNRPNVDNWRRFTAVSSQLTARNPNQKIDVQNPGTTAPVVDESDGPSFNSVMAKLPMDAASMKVSNDSIMNGLFNLGVVFINDLEDFPSAIATLEELRSRFPGFERMDEALFHLYYAYSKSGQREKAAQAKSALSRDHGDSRFAAIVTTGKDPEAKSAVSPAATRDYEAVYDMFIEGRFAEAKAAKKIADSTYQTNYWQPQLLYIESVYHIRQREDSVASNLLQTLIAQNNGTPLAVKAQNLLSVLQRRAEIEEELRNLQVERPEADTMITVNLPVVQKPKPVQPDTPAVVIKPKEIPVVKDTVVSRAVKADSIAVTSKPPVNTNPVSVQKADTVAKIVKKTEKPNLFGYSFDESEQHFAVLILDKVDAVFSGEARTALNRYNREKYSARNFSSSTIEISPEKKLVLIGPFFNAQESLDYMNQAKKLAPTEIIPWLKPEKYSFLILSATNLPVLEEKKDLTLYKQFLEQFLPGKF